MFYKSFTASRKLGVQKSLPDGELTSSLSVVVTVAKPRKGTIMPSWTVVQIHYMAGVTSGVIDTL